jgi:hypothetical protein
MAFDKLNDFPGQIREMKDHGRLTDSLACEILMQYYNTALQHAKFTGQRYHCRKVMFEISSAFCKGYFGTETHEQTPKIKKLK